jgi:hypothetical protein
MKRLLAAAAVFSVAGAAATPAAVLCQRKRSGLVVVRRACKKKETALDLAQFGAVGPKGDKGDPGTPGAPGVGPLTTCPPDSVLVGTTCVGTYDDYRGELTAISDMATTISPTIVVVAANPSATGRVRLNGSS